MPIYNPNSTDIAGLEWFPTRRLPRSLRIGTGIGVTLTAGASQSVDSLSAWLESAASAAVGVDIYDASSVWAPGDVVGGIDIPAVDVGSTAGWEQSTDGGATFVTYQNGGTHGYDFVSKAIPDSYSPSDILAIVTLDGTMLRYLPTGSQAQGHLTWQGSGTYVKVTDNSSGNDPSSSRVGWIEVNVAAKAQNGASPTVDGWLNVNGNNYGSADGPRRITSHWARYTYHFYWNPATGTQWYNADIAQFLSGGLNSFGLNIKGKVGTDFRIGAVNIVWRSLPERRVATGYSPGTAGAGFQSFPLLAPADGSTVAWSKAASTSYLALFFLTGSGGQVGLSGVDQASLADNPTGTLGGWIGADQATYPNTPIPNRAAVSSSWAPSVLSIVSAAPSVDSQPYVATGVMRVASTDGKDGQQLTTHASAVYGQATFAVAMIDAAGNPIAPDGPLVAQIFTVSGDTPEGGTISVDPSEVPSDGRFHLVTRHFSSSPTLASGTAYYLGFSTTSTVPWSVGYASTVDPAADSVVIAGSVATFNGVDDPTSTLLSSVGTVPPALTGLTASVQLFTPSVIAPGVPASGISYVLIEWDASSLGAAFGAYECDRSDDGGSTWQTIARITSEANNSFEDAESLRGVVTNYRIRVVRADGATSDYTS